MGDIKDADSLGGVERSVGEVSKSKKLADATDQSWSECKQVAI